MASLNGKVVAITGAASGIGRATAQVLASHGALLSLGDLNEAGLEDTVASLPSCCPAAPMSKSVNGDHPAARPPHFTFQLDVRDPRSCSDWITATRMHFDDAPIAAAANLAGVAGKSIATDGGKLRNMKDDEWDFVMGINCTGVFNCLRAELPAMRVGFEGKGRGGGSIVNAASIAGLVGIEANGPYVASKHAVVGLTKTAAKEEGPNAIRVNAIAPGLISTPMLSSIEKSKGDPNLFGKTDPGALGRRGDPEEVARLICFLLSDDSAFVNGTVVGVDGGWNC